MVGINSDVGIKRSLNEDCVGYMENDNFKLYLVADGMGGHNAGDVASKMAIDIIKDFVNNNINKYGINTLKIAIEYANEKIYSYALSNDKYKGMGTTIVACLIYNNEIVIANIGDSSALGLDSNSISKITKDNSLVQELIDSGSISEEEGRNHPQKNVITRALGTGITVKVDIYNIVLDKFNSILLCTDGLTNELYNDEIYNTIINSEDYIVACEKLVYLAKERGGRDNITVLLFGGEV